MKGSKPERDRAGPTPVHRDEEMAPEDVKQGCQHLLCDHWNPGGFETVKKELVEVVHAHQVDREQVVQEVGVRVLDDLLLLAEHAHDGLSEGKCGHQGQKDNRVYDPGSVKVDATQLQLLGAVGLGHQSFQGPIHPQDNIERQALQQ